MRSGELARLAGVTVRALRHYHRVGVLSEPERGGNGYRAYDVVDLVRVLRIKRLASLGIPLGRMPGVLDDAPDAAGLLDELDAELAGQIDRLQRQRALIARLRDHDARPDVPPEIAPFLAVFAAAGMSPEMVRFDGDQSVLLAHLAGEAGTARLVDVYERLADPELLSAVTAISERFERLGPDSGERDVGDLVEDIVAAFAPVFEEFAAADPPLDLGSSAVLVAELMAGTFNERQREALARLEARLEA
jgi:DNA-binding transcriptional MerR regulator